MTQIEGAVVLVTGGSRGIGKSLVQAFYDSGASKVYATARDPRTVTNPDAVPLALEITDPDSVAAAARAASDVTILVNNAGILLGSSLLDSPMEDIQLEFDTNFFGPLLTTRAFVPVIEANGGGHILNMHSVLSWFTFAGVEAYAATKAALWSQTNSLRLALLDRGILVTGLHVAYTDTDMVAHVDSPKHSPDMVARMAVEGIASNAHEVLVDELTQQVKAGLAADIAALYPAVSNA